MSSSSENRISTFRTSVSKFAYPGSPETSLSRDSVLVRHHSKSGLQREGKVENSNEEVVAGRKKKEKAKMKRGYAPPDVYAHLHHIQDHLALDLDVVFCGINPGYRSAEVGHHFANPTNHFWRCLHRSGLTSRLLLPSEDHTLPSSFSLGLTNLVDRPSSEQAELSTTELAAGVPTLLAKAMRWRPRILCFVGVGIWRIVERVILRDLKHADNTRPKAHPKAKKGSHVGLQPYKFVHSPEDQNPNGVHETLIFVVPSTSGRVVSHQLDDKVVLFASLKTCVDTLKGEKGEETVDTSNMTVINMV